MGSLRRVDPNIEGCWSGDIAGRKDTLRNNIGIEKENKETVNKKIFRKKML
jgi:hypothetical protein